MSDQTERKRQRGRPALDPDIRRDDALVLYLNREERRRLNRLSGRHGLPLNEVLRQALIVMERQKSE